MPDPASDPDGVRLAYYGDDFTGSTDVLEALATNGVETLLLLDPDAVAPGELDGVAAVGIAGRSRAMSPAEMDEQLPEAFATLEGFEPELLQYKVCSTFDSSPEVGSIGHAIDLARDRVDPELVPVVVAAPSLAPRGRYVVFGNLFATVDGTTYRLDRHPTMRDHPVTPMTEADLTRHLGEQTDRSVGSVSVRRLEGEDGGDAGLPGGLEAGADHDVVVFDGLTHDHQRTVGRLVWEYATGAEGTVVSASSSGLNYALCRHWHETGLVSDPGAPSSAEAVDRVIVVSGSASPVNGRQIEWALDHGFTGVELDTVGLIDDERDAREAARRDATDAALGVLEDGGSPLVHSARGPDDPRIEATGARADELGVDDREMTRRIGDAQGDVACDLLAATDVDRVCVAGGDTSGHVASRLDVYALEFLAPVGPGSPLCRARARTERVDGLEIALKGGQVETTDDDENYFGVVRDGGAG